MDVKCFITIINTKNRNGDGTEVLMTQVRIYYYDSFLQDKVGELVAALHTALSCRALRKYKAEKRFTSLKGHGLFVHRANGRL